MSTFWAVFTAREVGFESEGTGVQDQKVAMPIEKAGHRMWHPIVKAN
jgi:hypothetical protein